MNATDTSFILICSAMILFMTPALATFYAGLTRKKSGIDIMMQVWICFAAVGILWILFGFSLAFGSDIGGIFGGSDYLFLSNVGLACNSSYGSTIPFIVFFLLQVTYAIITPALICGTVAERMSFKAYILFVLVWSVVIYIPLAHMIWGGGLMAKLGMIDCAGGLVIHTSAGFSALAAALVLGKRKVQDNTPSNMAQISSNCGILLFGWLAFNAGSGLGVTDGAILAVVNSVIGSAAGMAVWIILTLIREKRLSFMSCMLGFLAGLVAVTPAAGVISNPIKALIMGLLVSCVCYVCINIIRPRAGFDDTLDVWGLHGMGGFTGTILLPLFADPDLAGFTSVSAQLGIQFICVAAGAALSFAATFAVLKLIGVLTPLRLPGNAESNVDEIVYKEKLYEI